ncbi:MAG: hypothetical protein RMK60_06610 [Burkholderiales bacterium]|nr:hypothetical protein [Burkholderiales bacterium]
MADTPRTQVRFVPGCPDCGRRGVDLPQVLPEVGDDFDWDVRDYDGFRQFMLEALVARFPERRRWTPADVEVALIEVLAAQLDKLSDMLDRITTESYLETARRPETVRRLLSLIGYDALGLAKRLKQPPFDREPVAGDTRSEVERLEQYWLDHPEHMDQARREGPRAIRTQRRMVTVGDHAVRLQDHPLVARAHAWSQWGGSWLVIRVAVIPAVRRDLDDPTQDYPDALWAQTERFHAERDIPLPARSTLSAAGQPRYPSLRAILHPYIEAYRMAGQAVQLERAVEVGVVMHLSVQVASNFYQSEVRAAVERALGTGPEGFFAQGRLRFGEDLWASDIVQTLMSIDGVSNVCVNRFKRLGDRFPDQAGTGRIPLDGLEVAVCDNLPDTPARGYYRLVLHGGLRG